jgi:hypothetical protein
VDETRKGLFIQPDDMNVGDYLAVVGCKLHDNPIPIAGLAFKVTAINMPFLIGQLVQDPSHAPITLDLRFLNVMRVTDEYVKAQAPQMPQGVMMTPAAILAAMRGQ